MLCIQYIVLWCWNLITSYAGCVYPFSWILKQFSWCDNKKFQGSGFFETQCNSDCLQILRYGRSQQSHHICIEDRFYRSAIEASAVLLSRRQNNAYRLYGQNWCHWGRTDDARSEDQTLSLRDLKPIFSIDPSQHCVCVCSLFWLYVLWTHCGLI